ncbi:MAG: type II toxin-antitoxin system VapC family toxin [Chloroflexi bacterium]|nr:type II toxin-antitoxin system VapC family toxin [Chloroflexota bacterium]
MIAIDTNVLVRYVVRDDAAQAEAARELLDDLTLERPGFICREVLVEIVWVLERAYGFARGETAAVVEGLVSTASLVVEDADAVARAAARYGAGGPDFADRLILAAAERNGARRLYTFDRRLARLEGAALLQA